MRIMRTGHDHPQLSDTRRIAGLSAKMPLLFVGIFIFSCIGGVISVTSPPYMVRQPPHELLYQISNPNREDRPVVLECEAKGDPAPEYKWTKNGQEFSTSGSDDRVAQEPGKGTLTIHRPKDIDEGLYQCRAENSYGVSLSNAVYLRRAGLDQFRMDNQVEEIRATEGEPLTIKCNPPTGNPRPNIFWILQSPNGAMTTVNGSRISVDPEGDLHFSNVTIEDGSVENFYACSAFSPFLREYKTGELKKLVVDRNGQAGQNRVAPVCQYTSPKHITGLRGQSIDISCIYGGTPLPQIKWTRRGMTLPTHRHFLTDFGKVLRIKDLQFEDQGTYECFATNGVGQPGSHAFTLTVESAPYWIVAPERALKAEEEDQTFSCMAKGVPEPQIQWFVNGTPIENLPPNPRRRISGTNITILSVQKDIDTDNYQCNASNAHGYIFADVYLNVLALPAEIVEPPAELSETVEGQEARITCTVYGAPHPTVRWEKDGQMIVFQPDSGERYEVLRNGHLVIHRADFNDIGMYTCIATNRLGEKRASGQLDVKRRTEITYPPEDLERKAGESATFRCSAASDPSLEIHIEWLRDGEPVVIGQSGRIFQSNDNSLTIGNAQEVHSGVYTCRARTRLDYADANATLIVRDVPNPPINVRVQCNQLSAQIAWEPNGDNREPIFEFVVEYMTSFDPHVWSELKAGIPGSDLSTSVELSPWVNYTFRVRARNAIGLSNASAPADEVCRTPPDVPYKNPDNIQGKGTSPDNLVISWTPMPQIDHNGPGFFYEVRWMRAEPDPIAQKVEEKMIISDWRQGSVTIPGQPTYVPFDVRVIANNDLGRSRAADAPPVRGFSGEDVPVAGPETAYALRTLDGRTAEIEWKPVPRDSVRGEFKGYKIQVTPEGESKPREMRVGPDASTAIVDILKPDSLNTIKVIPYNGLYDGSSSPEIEIKTPEAPPGRVSDLRAYPMGRTAVFLEWRQPEEPNGQILEYETSLWEYVGNDVTGPIRDPIIIRDPSGQSMKVTGLKPDTKYRIKVHAINRAGHGEAGIVEVATDANRTHEALALLPPPGPPDFVVGPKTNTSIYISWLPRHAVEEGHRTGEYFYVEHRRRGDGDFKKTEPEYHALGKELTDLEPGTTYEVRVVAVEGDHETKGFVREVTTEGVRVGGADIAWASSWWFILIIVLIALAFLVCCLYLCFRKKRGGKYKVSEPSERERLKGSPYDYEKQPVKTPEPAGPSGRGRPTEAGTEDESASMLSREAPSESDSMEEYNDPNDAKMFTEDGSWIGQYASNTVRSNEAVVTTTVQPAASGSTSV